MPQWLRATRLCTVQVKRSVDHLPGGKRLMLNLSGKEIIPA